MSLEDFFDYDDKPIVWGTSVEKERRLRIKLAVAAYAYEMKDHSIITDAEFDKMCTQVDVKVNTGNRKMDNFFKKEFDPSTGQWIHKHPELKAIAKLYEQYYMDC